MDHFLDNLEAQQNLSADHLFVNIWTSPRKVFKYIIERNYDKHVTVLLILAGIAEAFDKASMRHLGDKMPLWAILGLCLILGGLLGKFSYSIYATLVSWTGKWLKGQADADSILRILSYAMVPSVIGLFFLIPQIGIYGVEIFKSDGDITSAGGMSNILVYGAMFLEFVLSIWSFVLCVIGISEVQKLSVGQSILNLLLPFLLFLVPISIIVLLLKPF